MKNLLNKLRYKYSSNVFAICGIFCILIFLKLMLPTLIPNYEAEAGDISLFWYWLLTFSLSIISLLVYFIVYIVEEIYNFKVPQNKYTTSLTYLILLFVGILWHIFIFGLLIHIFILAILM